VLPEEQETQAVPQRLEPHSVAPLVGSSATPESAEPSAPRSNLSNLAVLSVSSHPTIPVMPLTLPGFTFSPPPRHFHPFHSFNNQDGLSNGPPLSFPPDVGVPQASGLNPFNPYGMNGYGFVPPLPSNINGASASNQDRNVHDARTSPGIGEKHGFPLESESESADAKRRKVKGPPGIHGNSQKAYNGFKLQQSTTGNMLVIPQDFSLVTASRAQISVSPAVPVPLTLSSAAPAPLPPAALAPPTVLAPPANTRPIGYNLALSHSSAHPAQASGSGPIVPSRNLPPRPGHMSEEQYAQYIALSNLLVGFETSGTS
jgi:hypothetical protein